MTTQRSAIPAGDLILHHYWMSPYAEKVRSILGFKRLAWKSVLIPIVMPKPDLTALGKVMIAFKGPELARRYIARMPFRAMTPNTITSPREFEAELDRIRARGYAVDNEEHAVGMRCVAAPVFNFSGKGVAAMGISGPSWSLTPEHVETVQPVVREFAHRLSRLLGYTPELAARPNGAARPAPRRPARTKGR